MLRDEVEAVLRSWHAYEVARGGDGIVDYDCQPSDAEVTAAPDRLHVLARLLELHTSAVRAGATPIAARLGADVAYLRALLGQQLPFGEYIGATQGCHATGWTDDDLDHAWELARRCLNGFGVPWDAHTLRALREIEGPLPSEQVGDAITASAAELEPAVRSLVGATAPFTVRVETVDVDAYWGFWLDGAGATVRLRLNLPRLKFSQVRARQLALHELLGHALQSASYHAVCTREDVPWVRILSVHTPHQVLLEGLAQALPLFATPDDAALTARVRLDHYLNLVRARLQLAINTGTPVEECAADARTLVPFWTDDTIADLLTDRGANPLLRSYLWAYPAGLDWFTRLADTADPHTVGEVLRAAYRRPLTPTDLAALWPAGPFAGGP